jgi:hypothetical protein
MNELMIDLKIGKDLASKQASEVVKAATINELLVYVEEKEEESVYIVDPDKRRLHKLNEAAELQMHKNLNT